MMIPVRKEAEGVLRRAMNNKSEQSSGQSHCPSWIISSKQKVKLMKDNMLQSNAVTAINMQYGSSRLIPISSKSLLLDKFFELWWDWRSRSEWWRYWLRSGLLTSKLKFIKEENNSSNMLYILNNLHSTESYHQMK